MTKEGEEEMKKWGILVSVFVCLILFFAVNCKSPATSEAASPFIAADSGSNSDSGSTTGSGGGGDSSDETTTFGTLVLKMKDKPVEDADQVWVTISSIKVHNADDDEFVELFNGSFYYDLMVLKIQEATLNVAKLKVGHYNQIRVAVTAGHIVFLEDNGEGGFNKEKYDFKIPSSEIKIPVQFQIEAGSKTIMVLDFDAGESIKVTKRGNKDSYILHPVIKVVSVDFQDPEY